MSSKLTKTAIKTKRLFKAAAKATGRVSVKVGSKLVRGAKQSLIRKPKKFRKKQKFVEG